MQNRALSCNLPAQVTGKIVPLLENAYFRIDTASEPREALKWMELHTYDVILMGHPLPDVSMEDLLSAARKEASPCRQTPILLIVFPGKDGDAEQYVGRGVNRVLKVNDDPQRFLTTILGLLHVEPRVRQRFLARLEVNAGKKALPAICQTENISTSGMLVQSKERFPVGTRIRFEFRLPADPVPVQGEGEVVRHTNHQKEEIVGMALKFIFFKGDSRERLKSYLLEVRH